MESLPEKSKIKISELKNYDILKSLLNYSLKKNIDIENISIEEYIIEIHKIIFNSSGLNSVDEYVNKLEILVVSLIENSYKISENEILFKYLSNFIKLLFDLLIKILKDKNNTNISQFSDKVLDLLISKDIITNSGIESKQLETILNYERFKKAYNASKSKTINKFGCYILLFFPEFVKNKDKEIKDAALKFLKEKQIIKFFKIYEEKESEDENDK